MKKTIKIILVLILTLSIFFVGFWYFEAYRINSKRMSEAQQIYQDISTEKIKLSDIKENQFYLKENGYLSANTMLHYVRGEEKNWTIYIGPLHPIPGDPIKFDSQGVFTKLTMEKMNEEIN